MLKNSKNDLTNKGLMYKLPADFVMGLQLSTINTKET